MRLLQTRGGHSRNEVQQPVAAVAASVRRVLHWAVSITLNQPMRSRVMDVTGEHSHQARSATHRIKELRGVCGKVGRPAG
jgi:hypothetical protein